MKKSDFLKIKYKFFINRALAYFSFLLIPIWIPGALELNLLAQSLLLLVYMLFMGGQWYFMGKEIDHRLKIFYRANSSMDRIVYRIVLGSVFMIVLFNVFTLFPEQIMKYLFWIFFGFLGLFYSWPTRGKIIEESMSDQFGEFRFLDGFEKTVLFLSVLMFFSSLPELQLFQNIDALKLFFDPKEQVNPMLWNSLTVIYSPFMNYPKLYNLIWSLHFYFFGLGIFLFSFYCILRYFYTRRLSILGVFAVISTWSFARTVGHDFFTTMSSTFSLLWLWAFMWSTRSLTYRSGLLTGLICLYGVIINSLNIVFLPLTLIGGYFFFQKNQTIWYKKQWVKYNIFGAVFSIIVFIFQYESLIIEFGGFESLKNIVGDHLYRKSFYLIAPIGLMMSVLFIGKKFKENLSHITLDRAKFEELFYGVGAITLLSVIFGGYFSHGFNYIWILTFFSILPLEWIFQSISRLRSKRNLIYALYILVCLLDSHFENRLRIIGKMFLDSESFKYFIQL